MLFGLLSYFVNKSRVLVWIGDIVRQYLVLNTLRVSAFKCLGNYLYFWYVNTLLSCWCIYQAVTSAYSLIINAIVCVVCKAGYARDL